MDGILIIDKPAGITSHDVVVRTRRILRERRIGHAGTLDPFATGVLLTLVGRATRLAQFLTDTDKEYVAIIRFGYATDTGDRTGKPIGPLDGAERNFSQEELFEALRSLSGWIDQVPPMYSAKKRQGQKLYELARRGETVQREPQRVCIHEFVPMTTTGSGMIKDNRDGTYDLETRVVCSSGTYVRTLAEDLGKRLGIGAHLAELRRTRVGPFAVQDAITLDDLQVSFADGALGQILMSPNAALSQLPLLHLNGDDERKARHGMEVKVEGSDWHNGTQVRMCNERDELIAIGDFVADQKRLHPRIVLVSPE